MLPTIDRSWYQITDHTADTGLTITAANKPELFIRCAVVICYLLGANSLPGKCSEQTITLNATNPGLLLADWANEFIYLLDGEGLCPVAIDMESLSDTELTARLSLSPATFNQPRVPLKAVTYHEADVELTADQAVGKLIVDI